MSTNNYEIFKKYMDELSHFIDTCETKEIDGELHILINDDNVREFSDIIFKILDISNDSDGYIEKIVEYFKELDNKMIVRNMIVKLIPLFAAIHCFATTKKLPNPNNKININDWVFELNNMINPAPLDFRFGKVVNIVENEDKTITYKVKAPLANEIVEWEDATLIVIPNMEETLKIYQEKYSVKF